MYYLNSDKNKCYFCGIEEPIVIKSKKFRSLIEIHHIIEKNDGGSNNKGNLVPCCGNCHSKIHLDIISIDKYYNLHYCWKLKWVDENGDDQFGPKQ